MDEEESAIIFQRPNKPHPKLGITLLAIIFVIGLYDVVTQHVSLLFLLLYMAFILTPTLILFIIGKFRITNKYSVIVQINKKENILSISNLVSLRPWWGFQIEKNVQIPLRAITKIEFHTLADTTASLTILSSYYAYGKYKFSLSDGSKLDYYTSGWLDDYKRYQQIGQKIADRLHIPFEQ
jgi:hypothetical protein